VNIVLSSGFLFPQQLGPIEYFNGVKDHLEQQGHDVIAPTVPPLKSCVARAEQLAKAINDHFKDQPIHLIAHSMGGLDCRMMIGRNKDFQQPGRILSLTTLSTPHQGSPVADLLAGRGPDDKRRQLFALLEGIGIDLGALRDLTSDVDDALPNVPKDFPHIPCFSYAASGRGGFRPTATALLLTYFYVQGVTPPPNDNDGVVTVTSATYGKFKGAWPCDHIQMVGHDLDTLLLPDEFKQAIQGVLHLGPEFDHLSRFDAIVADLKRIEAGQPQ
jgi:triacylglycerol lipase